MKKLTVVLVAVLTFTLSMTVFADHWADIPLKYMTDNGYLSEGDSSAYMTRLEVARALAKLNLIDKSSNYIFSDTSDISVVKVTKAGLMNGIGNQQFAPDGFITREEIAKVVAMLIANAVSYDDVGFADKDDIGEWALPYVGALKRDSIVLGYENNTFRPKNNVTSAEFATLFMKVRDAYSLNEITVNAANNAQVQPIEYLSVPAGYIGVLSIPSLGLNNLPVIEDGENLDRIKSVAGHFVNTALFDGNVGILGHNFTDKSPWFGKLATIQTGARITWRTKFGIRYYSVTVRQNINAEDWSSLMETGENKITIITCLKGQSDTTRIMVQATETAP